MLPGTLLAALEVLPIGDQASINYPSIFRENVHDYKITHHPE
jgi:hypothetical protein